MTNQLQDLKARLRVLGDDIADCALIAKQIYDTNRNIEQPNREVTGSRKKLVRRGSRKKSAR